MVNHEGREFYGDRDGQRGTHKTCSNKTLGRENSDKRGRCLKQKPVNMSEGKYSVSPSPIPWKGKPRLNHDMAKARGKAVKGKTGQGQARRRRPE